MSESSCLGAELLQDVSVRIEVLCEKYGIPEPLARQIGEAAATTLADTWGGQHVYFPMDLVGKNLKRNREIYDAFTGDNISELVARFGMARNTIYRIIKIERTRRQPRQHSLPGLS